MVIAIDALRRMPGWSGPYIPINFLKNLILPYTRKISRYEIFAKQDFAIIFLRITGS